MSDPAAAQSRRLPPLDVSSTSTEPPSETSHFSASRPGEFLLKARVTAPRRPHESKIVVIKKPLPGKRAAETFNVIPPLLRRSLLPTKTAQMVSSHRNA